MTGQKQQSFKLELFNNCLRKNAAICQFTDPVSPFIHCEANQASIAYCLLCMYF